METLSWCSEPELAFMFYYVMASYTHALTTLETQANRHVEVLLPIYRPWNNHIMHSYALDHKKRSQLVSITRQLGLSSECALQRMRINRTL